MYDDYGDEETRRRQRDEALAPYNPGFGYSQEADRGPGDGYGDPFDGIGSPESGYGPGGVENPAYDPPPAAPEAPTRDRLPNENNQLAPPSREPAPNNQPAFQPPAAAPAAPPQAPPPSVRTPGITDEVTKLLMARLNELKSPQDLNSDPIYQQAVRQNQIAQLRSADRQRKALAERTAATSGTTSSGGFNVGVQGILERTGENAAQYRSGLALDRLQSREAQLVEAIKLARAVGQDDIANQLELQRLALQQELGRGDLALRAELGRGQLGLGYDNLGLSYADLVMRANRDAVLAGLGA